MPQVWNLPTIGSGLPMVAEALYRRERDDERQRVLQSEDARRNEELGMRREQFGMQREQFGLAKESAAEQKRLQDSYAEFQTIKVLPPEQQEAWAAGIRAKDPRLANVPTPQLLQSIEAGLQAQLGIRETPGQLYKTAGGYQPYEQAIGQMPYDEPPQYAPERPPAGVSEAEWYRNATPEQRAAWDATHPRGSDRPQIIPPAYPGAPIYEVVEGPNGAEVRRVGESGGTAPAQAPTAAPASTAPPQRGEVRKGYRFKGGDPARKENWEPVGGYGVTRNW